MEDRSKRAETVRPQLDERCENRRECDGVLNVTNDENGDELNGETDDEDMEDGEMGVDDGSAQVRNIRDPGQPTAKEHQEHMAAHRPYRSWCKFRVMGRGVNAPHRRSDSQDDLEGVPHVSMDYGSLGERESENRVSPVLAIRERRHKMTWAIVVPRKGTEFPWIAKRAAKFIDQLGHNRVTLRCDNEPAIEALAREIAQARQEGVPERPPVGESQSNGIIERAVGLVSGQARTLKAALKQSHRGQSPARRKDIVQAGGVRGIPDEQVRHRQRRKDTATKTTQAKGQHTDSGVWRMDPAHARQTSATTKVGAAVPPRSVCWHAELFVRGNGCHRAGTGDQDKVANIRRVLESERRDAGRILEMRATPWSPDGSDNAFDIQVGMKRPG